MTQPIMPLDLNCPPVTAPLQNGKKECVRAAYTRITLNLFTYAHTQITGQWSVQTSLGK